MHNRSRLQFYSQSSAAGARLWTSCNDPSKQITEHPKAKWEIVSSSAVHFFPFVHFTFKQWPIHRVVRILLRVHQFLRFCSKSTTSTVGSVIRLQFLISACLRNASQCSSVVQQCSFSNWGFLVFSLSYLRASSSWTESTCSRRAIFCELFHIRVFRAAENCQPLSDSCPDCSCDQYYCPVELDVHQICIVAVDSNERNIQQQSKLDRWFWISWWSL